MLRTVLEPGNRACFLEHAAHPRHIKKLTSHKMLIKLRLAGLVCGTGCQYYCQYKRLWVVFEWDEEKCRSNKEKHGLSFEDAERVFAGPTVTFEDDRFDYGEPRFITFGILAQRMVVIAHTPRGDNIRIISMRKGTTSERQAFEKRLEALGRDE